MITASACYIPFITLIRPYLKEFGEKFAPKPYAIIVRLVYQPMYWTAAFGIACLVLYLLYDFIRRWLMIIKSSWNCSKKIWYKFWHFFRPTRRKISVSIDDQEDEEEPIQTNLILQVIR